MIVNPSKSGSPIVISFLLPKTSFMTFGTGLDLKASTNGVMLFTLKEEMF